MDDISDPRILAIMSKLNKDESNPAEGKKGVVEDGDRPPKPPLTLDDFIKAEHLNEWPLRLTSEKFMGVDEDKDLMGSQDVIMKELREATPVDMKCLTNLETRLQALEDSLQMYASRIVVPDHACGKSEDTSEKHLPSTGRAFMTDIQESDAVRAHPSRKSKKRMDFKESLLETKKRSVEHCTFPGFRQGELPELPGQLEAPQILNRVTKAQDFNAGFKKFWKKIFQSEASIAIMQDTFWWIFIDLFQPTKSREDQDRLFDRIADSFVALFTSVHPEIKDKFFQVYSDCLAQAVFSAFRESFPESDRSFQDDFKTRVINITSEWITGMHPPPQQWQKWDIRRLEPKMYKMAENNQTQAAKNLMDSANTNKEVVYSLDVEEFKRTVAKLGESSSRVGTSSVTPSREPTTVTKRPSGGASGGSGGGATNGVGGVLGVGGLLALPSTGVPAVSVSQQAECGTPKVFHSHQIGPGPELERTLFNLKGHSPLVAHYLRLRNLKGPTQPGRRVRRTEISKLQPQSLTYRQVINETLANSEALSKEYQKVCDMTNQEIAKIERQQREMNRNISKLQKELMFCKNSLEIKLLSENIIDKREREVSSHASKDKSRSTEDD